MYYNDYISNLIKILLLLYINKFEKYDLWNEHRVSTNSDNPWITLV